MWEFIYDMLDLLPPDFIQFEWVPGHLDDPQNASKKAKYLSPKFALQMHIDGNVHADNFADAGTRRHGISPITVTRANDRANLTELVQRHLILS